MKITDVTDQVEYGLNDDELLPLKKCICGKTFASWNHLLGVYKDSPTECPRCKRKYYFSVEIKVFQVE